MSKDGCGGAVGTEVRYQKIDTVYIVLEYSNFHTRIIEVFNTKKLAIEYIDYFLKKRRFI